MDPDHLWLIFLTILSSFIVLFLGLIYQGMRKWREEILEQLDKFCKRNDCEHEEIWDRIHHHGHTVEGNVVITGGGIRGRSQD